MNILMLLKIVAALVTIATGLLALVKPSAAYGFIGLSADGPRGISEIRSIFGGLFIVTGAIEHSGLSEKLFAVGRPLATQGVAALSIVGAILSNLVSNVPAVLLFRPLVPQLPDPQQAWLTLAMATTFAGNLTLLGSVANLIVAEVAQGRGVELSFREYLKAGVPITLVSLLLGVLWLSWMG